MDERAVREKYRCITECLIRRSCQITTMESCTSGLIASLITDTEGASAVMKGAFVTYSNEAKIRAGVPGETIEKYGVYSLETAAMMAEASMQAFDADISVGVTGSFGNADPANPDSVPGEVYFAVAVQGKLQETEGFAGMPVEASKTQETCRGAGERRIRREKKLILPPKPSRYEYKLLAADRIADVLIDIIC